MNDRLLVVMMVLALGAGCDDSAAKPGAGDDTRAGDVADATSAPDTTGDDDTRAPDDTQAATDSGATGDATPDGTALDATATADATNDAAGDDTTATGDATSAPDGDVPEVHTCVATCGELAPGPTGVTFATHPGAPEPLAASDATAGLSGSWEATTFTFYLGGTIVDGVAFDLQDEGATSGAVELDGGAWRLALELALAFDAQVGELTPAGTLGRSLTAAACEATPGAGTLDGAIACGDGWPEDVALPDPIGLRYDAASDTIELAVPLARDLLLAFVDADFTAVAELVLAGPAELRVTLARPAARDE